MTLSVRLRDPQTALSERLELADFRDYCRLVADAYEQAPRFDSAAVPHYKAMARDTERFFRLLQSKVRVEFVEYDPYPDAEALEQDVTQSGVLKVMTLYSEHPVFTPEENWKFRAVHDWFTHILARQPFTQRGEIRAYNTHAKMYSREALPALFTEIVGQACYQTTHGRFPGQKVTLLPGFDYQNLGRVTGHEIRDRRLAPVAHMEATRRSWLYALVVESSGRDTQDWRRIAADPNTPPEVLDELFRRPPHRDVFALLARNSNSAPELLRRLLVRGSHEVLDNPALPFVLLEQPSFFKELSSDTLQAVGHLLAARGLLGQSATYTFNELERVLAEKVQPDGRVFRVPREVTVWDSGAIRETWGYPPPRAGRTLWHSDPRDFLFDKLKPFPRLSELLSAADSGSTAETQAGIQRVLGIFGA